MTEVDNGVHATLAAIEDALAELDELERVPAGPTAIETRIAALRAGTLPRPVLLDSRFRPGRNG